jgi:tRNA(fMet)-specific endonuclease VapC
MPLYMLDTNICIYIRRKRPKEAMERFRKLKRGDAVISAITLGEMYLGIEKSNERDRMHDALLDLTTLIPVVAVDASVARSYGSLRAALERRGEMIGANDLWIAAHALSIRVTLVTNNRKEFDRVRGLTVENWIRTE